MGYLNSLEKSKKYLGVIMELFNTGSLTARLDTESQQFDWMDADELKVLIVKTNGLGDYEKDTGYPQGAITTAWETLKLKLDRGVKFLLDRVDNDEVLGLTIGRAAQNFTSFHMIPELDATRFANYAQGAGHKETGVTLNASNILQAFDDAAVTMNNKHVPQQGRILFVNNGLEGLVRRGVSRQWGSESSINTIVTEYNGMNIVYVPGTRFYDLIELLPGSASGWGYKKDSEDGKDINFMLIHPMSVVQAAKTASSKFVSADENQNVDSNMFAFRVFHDAFVMEPWKDGVYASTK